MQVFVSMSDHSSDHAKTNTTKKTLTVSLLLSQCRRRNNDVLMSSTIPAPLTRRRRHRVCNNASVSSSNKTRSHKKTSCWCRRSLVLLPLVVVPTTTTTTTTRTVSATPWSCATESATSVRSWFSTKKQRNLLTPFAVDFNSQVLSTSTSTPWPSTTSRFERTLSVFFFSQPNFFSFLPPFFVCQRYRLVKQEHFSWQMSDGAFLAAVAKVQAESEPRFVCPRFWST